MIKYQPNMINLIHEYKLISNSKEYKQIDKLAHIQNVFVVQTKYIIQPYQYSPLSPKKIQPAGMPTGIIF